MKHFKITSYDLFIYLFWGHLPLPQPYAQEQVCKLLWVIPGSAQGIKSGVQFVKRMH